MVQEVKIITSSDLGKENWLKHIEAWSNSADTQTNYCKQHNLSYHSFGYWRQVYLSEQKQKNPQKFIKASIAAPVREVSMSHNI